MVVRKKITLFRTQHCNFWYTSGVNKRGEWMRFFAVLFVVVLLVIGHAHAKGSSETKSAKSTAKIKKGNRKIFAHGYLSWGSNLRPIDTVDYSANLGLDFLFRYKLNEKNWLNLWVGTAKDLTDKREQKMQDAALSYQYKFDPIAKFMQQSISVGAVIPFSEHSRDRASLITALSVAPKVVFIMSKPIKGFSLSISPKLTRSFHDYKTTTYGASNVRYSASAGVGVGYAPDASYAADWLTKLSLSASVKYLAAWTYRGKRKTDKFGISETLGYSFDNQWGLSVTYSNNGEIYAADGKSDNIQAFDSDHATFAAQLSYNF